MRPTPLAKFADKPYIVRLPDQRLGAFFFKPLDGAEESVARYSGQHIAARFSRDHGLTWTDEQHVLTLPLEHGGWFRQDGFDALVDDEGEVHLFFLNDAHTGVVPAPKGKELPSGEEQRPQAGQLREKRLDIWHTRSTHGRTRWPQPRRLWTGYSGAINSVLQLRSGRIVLPFSFLTSRKWRDNRGPGPDQFTFKGQYDCTVLYSDDRGATWKESPTPVNVPVPDIVSAYGAVEPVVSQLKDGRAWMMIRTQMGRFYESFSEDGATWTPPTPTHLLSSDSPPAIVSLDDGRLVIFWNNCLRFPYAFGGRHIMHAAISDDDGRTWKGHREVALDPERDKPPPPWGDHGMGYPFASVTTDNKIILSTGQGASRDAALLVDPSWLYETNQKEDFSEGLKMWSTFGTRGVELQNHPQKKSRRVLSMRKTHREWPAAAVWNFPCTAKGSLRMRILVKRGFRGARISLTDHFSVPYDSEDWFHSLFNLELDDHLGASPESLNSEVGTDRRAVRCAAARPAVAPYHQQGNLLSGHALKLTTGKWHDLEFKWNCARQQCVVSAGGKRAAFLPLLRASGGPSYVRVKSTAQDLNDSGLLIEQIETKKPNP